MAQNIAMTSSNPFAGATNTIHFSNIENLKDTLDEIDITNIRTQFKSAKDPIYLAFDHLDRQPLKKVAKDFVRDLQEGFIDFITSLPALMPRG